MLRHDYAEMRDLVDKVWTRFIENGILEAGQKEKYIKDTLDVLYNFNHVYYEDPEYVRSKESYRIGEAELRTYRDAELQELKSLHQQIKTFSAIVSHHKKAQKTFEIRLRLSFLLNSDDGWMYLLANHKNISDFLNIAAHKELQDIFSKINKFANLDNNEGSDSQENLLEKKKIAFDEIINALNVILQQLPQAFTPTDLETTELEPIKCLAEKLRYKFKNTAYLMPHYSEALLTEVKNIDVTMRFLADCEEDTNALVRSSSWNLPSFSATIGYVVGLLGYETTEARERKRAERRERGLALKARILALNTHSSGSSATAEVAADPLAEVLSALDDKRTGIILEMLTRLETANISCGETDDSLYYLNEEFRKLNLKLIDDTNFQPRKLNPETLIAFYNYLYPYIMQLEDRDPLKVRFINLDLFVPEEALLEATTIPKAFSNSYSFKALQALLYNPARSLAFEENISIQIRTYNHWHNILQMAKEETLKLNSQQDGAGSASAAAEVVDTSMISRFEIERMAPLYASILESSKDKIPLLLNGYLTSNVSADSSQSLLFKHMELLASMPDYTRISSFIEDLLNSALASILVKDDSLVTWAALSKLNDFNEFAKSLNIHFCGSSEEGGFSEELSNVISAFTIIRDAKTNPLNFASLFSGFNWDEVDAKLAWLNSKRGTVTTLQELFEQFILNIDFSQKEPFQNDEFVTGFFNVFLTLRHMPGYDVLSPAISKQVIGLLNAVKDTEHYDLARSLLPESYETDPAFSKFSNPSSSAVPPNTFYISREALYKGLNRYNIEEIRQQISRIAKYRAREGYNDFVKELKCRIKELFAELNSILDQNKNIEPGRFTRFFQNLIGRELSSKEQVLKEQFILKHIYSFVELIKNTDDFNSDTAFIAFLDQSITTLSLRNMENLSNLHTTLQTFSELALVETEEDQRLHELYLENLNIYLCALWQELRDSITALDSPKRNFLTKFLIDEINLTLEKIINTTYLYLLSYIPMAESSHTKAATASAAEPEAVEPIIGTLTESTIDSRVLDCELFKIVLLCHTVFENKELYNNATYKHLSDLIDHFGGEFGKLPLHEDIAKKIRSIGMFKGELNDRLHARADSLHASASCRPGPSGSVI